jgi:hypothetical protein
MPDSHGAPDDPREQCVHICSTSRVHLAEFAEPRERRPDLAAQRLARLAQNVLQTPPMHICPTAQQTPSQQARPLGQHPPPQQLPVQQAL